MGMITLNFDALAQSFLNHVSIERGLAANSVAAYRRDLSKLSEFLGQSRVEDIDSTKIAEFISDLKHAKLAAASINRIESTLRTFFKYLQLEHGFADPTLEIESSKTARRLPKALSVEDIIKLIAAALHEGQPITLRDQTMVELLYSSGARVSELIGINMGDISLVESEEGEITTLKLRGKGGKERVVPLGAFATKAIDEYKTRIRPELAAKSSKANSALFLNARGGRITRQSAWNIVLRAAESAGITQKVTPHVFRHSYATHLLDGGADIRVVQELLGHASVTTTQIYTLITIDRVRESYAMAHPRA
ncbi:MAG: integrase/recombinase XerD [Actinobacteria bacterium]|jgi:integrase/recombinase XerD|nr:integrase/recombinase XerD [Actinomycetota bacterium]